MRYQAQLLSIVPSILECAQRVLHTLKRPCPLELPLLMDDSLHREISNLLDDVGKGLRTKMLALALQSQDLRF